MSANDSLNGSGNAPGNLPENGPEDFPENWDVYICMVEDRPASIMVNLALGELAPLARFPVLGRLGLGLKEPDGNGFPGPGEYETLGRMEDALTAALADTAIYAGRCIRDGELDFFFYLPAPAHFGRDVERAMAAFDGYDWESASMDDPDWEVYRDFLFPGEYDMLGIQNRRALARLEGLGDDPALARAVEHWLDLPTVEAVEDVALLARERGFAVARGEADDGGPEDGPEALGRDSGIASGPLPPEASGRSPAVLRLIRPDTLEDIDDIVLSLARLARGHGGRYLGWACPATRSD